MNVLRVYGQLMARHPIKTQCVTTGVLVASGDIIAQKLIERQKKLNVTRTAKFAAFGLVYIVMVDQATFNPLINLFALPILGFMNRQTWEEIKDSIRQNYVDIMKASYKIWPAVQMVNFYYVPLNYRSVFVSGFSLVWNSYYTWKLGEKTPVE